MPSQQRSRKSKLCKQLLAQIFWGHNIRVLGLERLDVCESYARATQQHGWSRNILVHQIKSVYMEALVAGEKALSPAPFLGRKDVPEER